MSTYVVTYNLLNGKRISVEISASSTRSALQWAFENVSEARSEVARYGSVSEVIRRKGGRS